MQHDSELLETAKPGVIWISGFSGAGKSTVGREVVARLKEVNTAAVFLDGDILRNILKSRWGYSREERVELARVYFQFSSYLASQDITVVTAAVALYDEARSWLHENVPNALEVFLDVPEEERRRRDAGTKNVYRKIAAEDPGYTRPASNGSALIIDNHSGTSPSEAAARIVDAYVGLRAGTRAFGKATHWDHYYRQTEGALAPSAFATHVADSLLGTPSRILEVGCGNGRDAAFFASAGHEVVAMDASAAAVELCRSLHTQANLRFIAGTADTAELPAKAFDVVYSRFVLHAMTQREEGVFIARALELLAPGGRLLIECRSINDPLALVGDAISPTERIHGHYRRFIVAGDLMGRLSDLGFRVDHVTESKGLAVHGNEDPVVLRVVASKVRRN